MTSPKSVIALLLFASISIVACKKDKAVTPKGDALFIEIAGGYTAPASAEHPYKKIQITAAGSYEISYTGESKPNIRRLPGNIHDSLKPYLSSFPRATVKADPNEGRYDFGSGADVPYTAYTFIQETPADTASIKIAWHTFVPYMQDFQLNVEQTIKNCHLLEY
ncbi:hypothetical protein [Chitinophaga sp.]|uniref:hypothetical protein n=1 Tax=Chitinophaga sp. TaxID=1869181 RepID=UPI002F94F42C